VTSEKRGLLALKRPVSRAVNEQASLIQEKKNASAERREKTATRCAAGRCRKVLERRCQNDFCGWVKGKRNAEMRDGSRIGVVQVLKKKRIARNKRTEKDSGRTKTESSGFLRKKKRREKMKRSKEIVTIRGNLTGLANAPVHT